MSTAFALMMSLSAFPFIPNTNNSRTTFFGSENTAVSESHKTSAFKVCCACRPMMMMALHAATVIVIIGEDKFKVEPFFIVDAFVT